MRRLGALAALLAACGSPAGVSVSVDLVLDDQQCAFVCKTPDDCPLDCEGQVGWFLLDADTGKTLASRCVDLVSMSGQSLRALPDLLVDAKASAPEGTRVAVEVVVYAAAAGCPLLQPDPAGGWSANPDGTLPLYAGRSSPVTLGGGDVSLEVPLACVAPQQCTQVSTPEVSTFVRRLDTGKSPDYSEAVSLDVHAGYVVYGGMDTPFSAQFSPALDLTLLGEEVSPEPLWQASSTTGIPFFIDCLATIVTRVGAGPAVSTASCELVQTGTEIVSGEARYLDAENLGRVLAALGQSSLPAGGLLVGRLRAGSFSPQQVTVRPISGSATIQYLEEDGLGGLVVKPAGSWFVATDASVMPDRSARCCELFEAVDAATGDALGTSSGRLGLIDGVVMAGEIQLK